VRINYEECGDGIIPIIGHWCSRWHDKSGEWTLHKPTASISSADFDDPAKAVDASPTVCRTLKDEWEEEHEDKLE